MSCVPIVAVRQLKLLRPGSHRQSQPHRDRLCSAESRTLYYSFDILIHEGRSLIQLPLSERRAFGRGKKHSSPGGFQDLPVLRIALAAVGALSASASHFRHRHADIVVIICCIS